MIISNLEARFKDLERIAQLLKHFLPKDIESKAALNISSEIKQGLKLNNLKVIQLLPHCSKGIICDLQNDGQFFSHQHSNDFMIKHPSYMKRMD